MNKKHNILLFLIPSLVGAALFLVPYPVDGSYNIGVGIIKDFFVEDAYTGAKFTAVLYVILAAMAITSIMSIIHKIKPLKFVEDSKFLKGQFEWSNLWSPIKILGTIFAFTTFFAVSPGWEVYADGGFLGWSTHYIENTGAVALYDLLPSIAVIFFVSGFFLPLLMSFGLMEFVGTLISPAMKPLFKVPGRASVDAVTSFLGDGTLGVHITEKQYIDGHYTKREAAAVAASFSLVSLPFAIVIMETIGLSNFGQFYGSVVLVSLIIAIIVPRIPPITWIDDNYISGEAPAEETRTKGLWATAYDNAMEQANGHNDGYTKFLTEGLQTGLGALLTLLPIVMAIGTTGMLFAEFTPVFDWLGWPLEQIFKLMNIANPGELAVGSIIGFADMFLPALLFGGDEVAESTRFIIGTLSVAQVLFLSETGAVLLKSKMEINFQRLVMLFAIRTAIALPILMIISAIIY